MRIRAAGERASGSIPTGGVVAHAGVAELTRRAKASQWRADDLPWTTDVDIERAAVTPTAGDGFRRFLLLRRALRGSRHPASRWDVRAWHAFAVETLRWSIAQSLHGERGAHAAAAS